MTLAYRPQRPPVAGEIELRGLRCHLKNWPGSDPAPIVLLHGWMDTGDTFQFLVDALSATRSFVALDWRGFGHSEWPQDGYWFPDYFGDLDALLERLSPGDPVTLVGHSLGGNVALMYAGIRPERVRRVVSIEGLGLPRTQPGEAPGRYRTWLEQLRSPPAFADADSADALAQRLLRRNARLLPERAAFIAQAWVEVRADGRVAMRGDPAHKRINPVLYRREEAESCWREITAPVLCVVGGDSELLRRLGNDAQPSALARVIRGVEIVVVPEAGHMAHHDQPEQLAVLVEAFLGRT